MRGIGSLDLFAGLVKPPRPPPPAVTEAVTPTIGVYLRTDSQFTVEESVATPVYVQTSYGMRKNDLRSQ